MVMKMASNRACQCFVNKFFLLQFHTKHMPTTTTTIRKPSPEVFIVCNHKAGGKVAKHPNLSHKLHSLSNIEYKISNIINNANANMVSIRFS